MKNNKKKAEMIIENISFSYNGTPVLENITFSASRGKTTIIMGPNGSGKTTLFKILDLLLKPDNGEIIVNNRDILSLKPKQAREFRKKVSFVFQEPYLFNMKVQKNIAYPLKIRGYDKETIKSRIIDLTEQFRLSGILSKKPHQLSGGDKKRVSFAQALASKPEILLMDEPTASMDPENCLIIENFIKDIKRDDNIFVIMATHDVFQSKRLADNVGFLFNGKIVEFGKKQQMIDNPEVELTRKFLNGEILI